MTAKTELPQEDGKLFAVAETHSDIIIIITGKSAPGQHKHPPRLMLPPGEHNGLNTSAVSNII